MIKEAELRRCWEKAGGTFYDSDSGEHVRIPTDGLVEFANDLTTRTDESRCLVPGSFSNRCCCNCRFHVRDRSHPSTDGGRVLEERGFVCVNPELEDGDGRYVHSGWSGHGLCESHEFKKSAVRTA